MPRLSARPFGAHKFTNSQLKQKATFEDLFTKKLKKKEKMESSGDFLVRDIEVDIWSRRMDTVDDTEIEEEIPWHKFMLSSKGRYLLQSAFEKSDIFCPVFFGNLILVQNLIHPMKILSTIISQAVRPLSTISCAKKATSHVLILVQMD